jgi:hypothetical protein
MRVYLTKTRKVGVANYAEASRVVRAFVDANDMVAGCGSSTNIFVGGKIVSELGNEIARVSYNGRVWDMEGREICAC